MLSTHVEVVRSILFHRFASRRALHARGGGPAIPRVSRYTCLCSPRTWRWSARTVTMSPTRIVLSTHVEVVRGGFVGGFAGLRALHARGGGPAERDDELFFEMVLSTHVEVVLPLPRRTSSISCALHARGGGPMCSQSWSSSRQCSPRTWRWSGGAAENPPVGLVLSTHVEVVRHLSSAPESARRALHARGGGPEPIEERALTATCSPRTWRWSEPQPGQRFAAPVLSTHVEVVRIARSASSAAP